MRKAPTMCTAVVLAVLAAAVVPAPGTGGRAAAAAITGVQNLGAGVGAHVVSLWWDNPADPSFRGVTIRRALGTHPPASPTAGQAVATVGPGQSTYTDIGLQARTTYSYSVFAMGPGTFSSAAVVTPTTRAMTGPDPVLQPNRNVTTADALPTVQMNGVAWSQVIIGNTVYVGGSFTKARPFGSAAGVNEVSRSGLLAYNLSTGGLIPGFVANANAQVRTVTRSPGGRILYVGGDFTRINGVVRNHIAALDPATGRVLTTFAAGANGRVNAIAATVSSVYYGGIFTAVHGLFRKHLAAVSASNGQLRKFWTPGTNRGVVAMVLTPDGSKLIVGGNFALLNGVDARGVGALDAVTGATRKWLVNTKFWAYGPSAGVDTLTTDGHAIYGGAWNTNGNTTRAYEGVWSANPADGSENWFEDCHGDTYSVFAANHVVYTAGHAHDCGRDYGFPESPTPPRWSRRIVAFTDVATGYLLHNRRSNFWDWYGNPSPSVYNFFPDFTPGSVTGKDQAVWNVTGNGNYLAAAGEFVAVNGQPQQGLVRFAIRGTPGNPGAVGPTKYSSGFTPTLTATNNSVAGRFPANSDRDDKTLKYVVLRDGTTVVWTAKVDSTWWNLPTLTFTDTGLQPNTRYTYQLVATDPHGNKALGRPIAVTTSS